ncbi:MAG: VPLPA-CTERM sorting domain-containing protein [Pseudomonadota bacterium]
MLRTAAAATILALLAGASWAETLNFDNLSDGEVITGVDFSGVSFTVGSDDIQAADLVLRANNIGSPVPTGFSQDIAIESSPFTNPNPFTGTFSISGVRSVSLGLGDFGADSDSLFLTAFDGDGNTLATDTEALGAGEFSFLTLSLITTTDIASVSFGSSGAAPNSVFFDDFSFETIAVPLPAGLALLLSGLAVFGVTARRRA